jgi:hypothetical protein
MPARRYCPGVTRRSFLADTGMGFTGLALGAMLFRDGVARAQDHAPPDGKPHHPPKAKSVIWIFMCGGVSHVESFDVKPELTKYDGKTIDETPYKGVDNPEKLKNVVGGNPEHGNRKKLMGLTTGHKKYGQSGLAVGDWWKHVGGCADDIAVVRSLWTTDNDHGAQLQFVTGRHVREGAHPTIGSWCSYGLGTLNQNLPEYVVLGVPTGDCCGGEWTHGAAYLGPEHAGVRLNVDGKDPLPFVRPAGGVTREEQTAEFSLLGRLNKLAGIDYPDDPVLRARIKSYELAFGMQTAVPETLQLEKETEATRKLYGLDQKVTAPFGKLCLTARRLVERGVRFVELLCQNLGHDRWDQHSNLKKGHEDNARAVDRPIAGLLADLKGRDLLKDTLVIWGGEFGRALYAQGSDGRDHNAKGYSIWMAGGGVRGGLAYGRTDDYGYEAVEDKVHVHDWHATVLHLLGLDHKRLTFNYGGRDFRLTDVYGNVVKGILA